MLQKLTERQEVYGFLPFLTTTQPLKEDCIMADSTVSKPKKICKVEGCERIVHATGRCWKHYECSRKGIPMDSPTLKDRNDVIIDGDIAYIILRNRRHEEDGRAIIDTEDLSLIAPHRWTLSKTDGYVYSHCNVKGPKLIMHRIINKTPEGMFTDHINHNKQDNRKANLRNATKSQNCCYQRVNPEGTSKYKGVHFMTSMAKYRKPWVAQIVVKGVHHSLGYYPDETSAAIAYNEGAKRLHGEFACLNKVT